MGVSQSKTIKLVGRKHFTLELVQSSSGVFYVVEESNGTREHSESIQDLHIAMSVFDFYLIRLEGN